jgi:hypothetical protein
VPPREELDIAFLSHQPYKKQTKNINRNQVHQATIKKTYKTRKIVPVHKLTGFLNANFDEKIKLFTTDK